METLFEVAQSMITMAEYATCHLFHDIETKAIILCFFAIILVFSVSAIRWIISLTIKAQKQ